MPEQNARSQYTVSVPNPDVTIFGRLVAQPEMRATPSGAFVTSCRVAVSRSYQQNEEWKEVVSFYRFSIWRDAAERLNGLNLNAGDVVQITFDPADLQARAYESNGEWKASLEGTAGKIKLIARKAGSGQPAMESTDEIPF